MVISSIDVVRAVLMPLHNFSSSSEWMCATMIIYTISEFAYLSIHHHIPLLLSVYP